RLRGCRKRPGRRVGGIGRVGGIERVGGIDRLSRLNAVPEAVGGPLQEAIEVMDTLRSEGGCPWDREQTHASLAPYAVEEAHEVAEAAATGDRDELIEELGDLLLQVLFHARVGAEGTLGAPFDLDDVAATLVAKLRRRHPHVFADSQARTSAEV